MAICQDLQDGTLDGSYTQAQLQAFLSDPTVQGYCNVIVPPCVLQEGGGNSTACRPAPPQCAEGETVGGNGQCASAATHTQTAPAPVPLTPVAVKAAAVKGATHTVRPHRAAPLGTTRTSGTLPFTGVQLSVVLAFGLALIGAGVALRYGGRASSKR